MSKMSLIDKLGILVNLAIANRPYLIALAVLLIFGIVLSFTNRKNEKKHKVIYFIITAVIAGLIIASYHSSLGNMFNYMMNNFFIAVYFPTIAIYLAAIIVFVGRMFTNLAIIRRYYIDKWSKKEIKELKQIKHGKLLGLEEYV